MRPFSTSDRFFSSLKQAMHTNTFLQSRSRVTNPNLHNLRPPYLLQVEKRLASEKQPATIATPSSPISFSSPLYLSSSKPQTSDFNRCPLEESSDAPSEFLSIPLSPEHDPDPDPDPDPRDPDPQQAAEALNYDNGEDVKEEEEDEDDDINSLISLLGLSADGEDRNSVGSCHCSTGGFYRNTVGVKGPMCARETERIDGWIEHYRRRRTEPARLAHLLLAKAVSPATSGGGDDDGFGGVGFPPTVEEFLEYDPPSEIGE